MNNNYYSKYFFNLIERSIYILFYLIFIFFLLTYMQHILQNGLGDNFNSGFIIGSICTVSLIGGIWFSRYIYNTYIKSESESTVRPVNDTELPLSSNSSYLEIVLELKLTVLYFYTKKLLLTVLYL